jgi:hypothetical protein
LPAHLEVVIVALGQLGANTNPRNQLIIRLLFLLLLWSIYFSCIIFLLHPSLFFYNENGWASIKRFSDVKKFQITKKKGFMSSKKMVHDPKYIFHGC